MTSSLVELLESRIPSTIDPATVIDCEAEFCQQWVTSIEPDSMAAPLRVAMQGGLLAYDFATVFIAGYQAAIRSVFAQDCFDGIVSFAVSEDRSESDPLPGVYWQETDQNTELNGTKTWVAAGAAVDQLVIRARHQSDQRPGYFLIPANHPGVQIELNPQPSMLPSLSQARAHLRQVLVPTAAQLDDAKVARFGQVEALCIYAAFVAWQAHESASDESVASDCRRLAEFFDTLDLYAPDATTLLAIDDGVQALREHLASGRYVNDSPWQRDQRLITMYSRGIRKAAGQT